MINVWCLCFSCHVFMIFFMRKTESFSLTRSRQLFYTIHENKIHRNIGKIMFPTCAKNHINQKAVGHSKKLDKIQIINSTKALPKLGCMPFELAELDISSNINSIKPEKTSSKSPMAVQSPATTSCPVMCDSGVFSTSIARESTTAWQLCISSSMVSGLSTASTRIDNQPASHCSYL